MWVQAGQDTDLLLCQMRVLQQANEQLAASQHHSSQCISNLQAKLDRLREDR